MVCACVNVFLLTRAIEVLVFVCSRCSCNHMTEVGKFVRRALKIVTQNDRDFTGINLLYHCFVR